MKEQLQQALMAVKEGHEEQARSILAQLLKEDPENVAGWVLLSKLAQTEVQKVAFLRKVLALDPDNEYAVSEMAALEADVVEPSEPMVAEPEATVAEAEPAAAPEPKAVEAELEQAPEAALPPPPEEMAGEETPVAAPETELPARQAEEAQETQLTERPEQMPVSEEPLDYEAQADADTLPPWLADEEAVEEPAAPETERVEEELPPPAELPDWLEEEPEEAWAGEQIAEDEAATEPVDTTEPAETDETVTPAKVPARADRMDATPGANSGVIVGLGILLVVIFLILVYVVVSIL